MELTQRLAKVRRDVPGCESLSVVSTQGLLLATTHDTQRPGELLAAVSSYLLKHCTKGLDPVQAGECRALDFRGDRQVIMIRLSDVEAFLVCVLHPGAHSVNLDEPSLRAITKVLPGVLQGREAPSPLRYYLVRDKTCWIPVKYGGLTIGRDHACDVVLAGDRVDPTHVRIDLLADRVVATDLDTTYGTKRNNKRFKGAVDLEPGDRINVPRCSGFTLLAVDTSGDG